MLINTKKYVKDIYKPFQITYSHMHNYTKSMKGEIYFCRFVFKKTVKGRAW